MAALERRLAILHLLSSFLNNVTTLTILGISRQPEN